MRENEGLRRRKVTNETKDLIIQKYHSGLGIKQICEFLQIPASTVGSIIKIFNENGSISNRKRGGDFSSKLNNDQKVELISWVDENASVTLK